MFLCWNEKTLVANLGNINIEIYFTRIVYVYMYYYIGQEYIIR